MEKFFNGTVARNLLIQHNIERLKLREPLELRYIDLLIQVDRLYYYIAGLTAIDCGIRSGLTLQNAISDIYKHQTIFIQFSQQHLNNLQEATNLKNNLGSLF